MKQETKSVLLLIMLACIWGSSFILMKKGMFDGDHNPIFSDKQVGALRMFLAGLVLLPFALRAVKKVKDWKVWLALLASGLFGNFIPAFLFTYAEQGVSSGYAGMLNSFTPIFTLLIGFLFFQNKLTPIQLLGVFIGTIGIIILSTSGDLQANKGTYYHIFAIIFATLLYGISLNLIKYKLSHFKAIEISSLAFLTVFVPATFSIIYFDAWGTLNSNPHAIGALGYIAILSVVGTAFAVIIFSHIITISSTLFASSVTYLIPIVAVLIGFAFKEAINPWQVVAMFIILIGVFIANYLPALRIRLRK
jgi:drug/metabolite transporter (DMT)-like permease